MRATMAAILLLAGGCSSTDSDSDDEDASAYAVGYHWAEENGITDPNDCGGKSGSFIEGCQSYAEEQQ